MPLRQRGTGRRQSSEVLAAESGKDQEGGNSMEKGRLCLCATPIGNLEDISLRVLRYLREADLIAAEDTRNSARLLAHFGIRTPMTSYHEFNKYDKAKLLLQELLKGKSIALITDAGMPCISDPGEELVREAAMAGISVTSLPGPSAVLTALSLSGLPSGRFSFEGFLPRDKKERQERLREIAEENLDSAREKLLERLSNYRAYSGKNVILVFDAYRLERHPVETALRSGVRVVFTKEAQTADRYIEELSRRLSEEGGRVEVASGDRLVQLIAWSGRGVSILSAADLERELERVEEEIRREHLRFDSAPRGSLSGRGILPDEKS